MVIRKTSTSRPSWGPSIRWTGRDQLLAPPLTGPFFIGKYLENDLKDPDRRTKVSNGRVSFVIRIAKLKKSKENNQRGAYER